MTSEGLRIKGIYRDILRNAANQVVSDSGWQSNTILNGCRMLLAGFMRNDNVSGIQYLSVGQGDEAWDTDGAPSPNPQTTTGLVSPAAPNVPFSELDVVFLNQQDQVVNNPTPRLQVTATLNPGFPLPIPPATSYPLREFGLFGRLGNTDFMLNNIRHPVLLKDTTSTLIRVIRLYF